MRYFYPCKLTIAQQAFLATQAGSVLWPHVSEGELVLEDETTAQLMMRHEGLGGLITLELDEQYIMFGADTEWGWDWGWRTLCKAAPVAGTAWAAQDEMQFYANLAEDQMLGRTNKTELRTIAEKCRTANPNSYNRPVAKQVLAFRLHYGRSPNTQEMRKMGLR